MKKIIINDNSLKEKDVIEKNSKVRALLISNNSILVANYANIIMLPGGSIENNEDKNKAILRELKEETGIKYDISELKKLVVLKYYQDNYPKQDNTITNRLIKTYYYTAEYKGISLDNQHLTEKEKKKHFRLELVDLDNIEKIVLAHNSDNPRNIYFQREVLEVIKYYKRLYH